MELRARRKRWRRDRLRRWGKVRIAWCMLSEIGVVHMRSWHIGESILSSGCRQSDRLLWSEIRAHMTDMIPGCWARDHVRLWSSATRSKGYTVGYGRRGRRCLSDMLKAGAGRRNGMGSTWWDFLRNGRCFIVIIIIKLTSLTGEVFGAFVFMRRNALEYDH